MSLEGVDGVWGVERGAVPGVSTELVRAGAARELGRWLVHGSSSLQLSVHGVAGLGPGLRCQVGLCW